MSEGNGHRGSVAKRRGAGRLGVSCGEGAQPWPCGTTAPPCSGGGSSPQCLTSTQLLSLLPLPLLPSEHDLVASFPALREGGAGGHLLERTRHSDARSLFLGEGVVGGKTGSQDFLLTMTYWGCFLLVTQFPCHDMSSSTRVPWIGHHG